MGLLFFIIVLVGIIYFLLCLFTESVSNKTEIKDVPNYSIPISPMIKNEPKYETTTFNIAGTTFSDGREKRQTALKMLKFKDAPMDGPIYFEFEQYEFGGQPAVKIIANERVLGTVPANLVMDFIDKMSSHNDYEIDYKVIGGGDYNYGCTMTFTWM